MTRENKMIIFFLILGNSIPVLWNTLLFSLDFYSNQFEQPKLAFYIMIPSTISIIISNLFYSMIYKFISVSKNIIRGLFLICIAFILFPLSAYLFPNNIGLGIFLALVFVWSFIATISYCSIMNFVSAFPLSFLFWYNAGISISSILSAIVRIILLLIFDINDKNDKICIFIQYSISFAFVFLAFTLVVFYEFSKNTEIKRNLIDEEFTSDSCGNSATFIFDENNNKFLQIKELVKKHFSEISLILPYSLLIMILNIQHSFCFPGLILDYVHLTKSKPWDMIILYFVASSSDLFGRLLILLNKFASTIQCTMFILCRFFLCIIFGFLSFDFDFVSNTMNNIISVGSLILFCFSFGYFNSFLFMKGVDYFQEKDKKQFASYLLVLLSNFGSIFGSLAILVLL